MPTYVMHESFTCDYCGKEWNFREQAEECEKDHEIVLVKISKAELKRLLAFMTTFNPQWLTPELVDRLQTYNTLVGG